MILCWLCFSDSWRIGSVRLIWCGAYCEKLSHSDSSRISNSDVLELRQASFEFQCFSASGFLNISNKNIYIYIFLNFDEPTWRSSLFGWIGTIYGKIQGLRSSRSELYVKLTWRSSFKRARDLKPPKGVWPSGSRCCRSPPPAEEQPILSMLGEDHLGKATPGQSWVHTGQLKPIQ